MVEVRAEVVVSAPPIGAVISLHDVMNFSDHSTCVGRGSHSFNDVFVFFGTAFCLVLLQELGREGWRIISCSLPDDLDIYCIYLDGFDLPFDLLPCGKVPPASLW